MCEFDRTQKSDSRSTKNVGEKVVKKICSNGAKNNREILMLSMEGMLNNQYTICCHLIVAACSERA